jgi:hypothetical protein
MSGNLPQKMTDLSLPLWFLFSLQSIVTTHTDILYFSDVISLLIRHSVRCLLSVHQHDGGKPVSCLLRETRAV